MERKLKRMAITNLHAGIRGNLTGIRGNLTGIRGDLSGIRGDLSGIAGDLSGIAGDVDDCDITKEEREKGINIEDLITLE